MATRNEWMSALAEGFHTGLRKGADGPESAAAWRAISDMPAEQYEAAIAFLLWGLETMGLVTLDPDPMAAQGSAHNASVMVVEE